MFGIGIGELILIFVVALLVVGPKKLPEMAKTLARVLREVRKTSDEFQASFLRESGAQVSGLLQNPKDTLKRHLENEVKEVLDTTPDKVDASAAQKEAPLGAHEGSAKAKDNAALQPVKRQEEESIDVSGSSSSKEGEESLG